MHRALIVDLFSTLIPGGHVERQTVHREMASILGVEPEAFAGAFDATVYERFTGVHGDLPSTLREIARRSGGQPTVDQVRRATELRRTLARQLIGAAPASTLIALAQLRALGWRTGLVSNITSETQLQWPGSALSQHFEVTAFSAEVGVAKPEAAIYLTACEGLGVDPAECVYVADGSDNELQGAAALGMYAIRTTEHADSDPAWTGPTISSFAALPDLLGAARSAPLSPALWPPGTTWRQAHAQLELHTRTVRVVPARTERYAVFGAIRPFACRFTM